MSARPIHRLALAAAALASLGPALAGCLPLVTRTRTGTLLPERGLRALRDGATTRREVLDLFGPPLAVVTASSGTVRVPLVEARRIGEVELPAASFFEPFAPYDAGPGDAVWFYRRHELRTNGGGIATQHGVLGSSRDEHRDDRLWILLDRGTGVVKAHRHVREGPPPPAEPEPDGGTP